MRAAFAAGTTLLAFSAAALFGALMFADSAPMQFDTLESAELRARSAQRHGRHTIMVKARPSGTNPNSPIAMWNGCRGFVQSRERRNLGTADKPQVAIVAWSIVLDVVDVLEAARAKRERAAIPLAVVKIEPRRVSPTFKAR